MTTTQLETSANGKATAAYKAKNYDRLLGLSGFSDKLLQAHFKLYEGYVTNTNKALDKLKALGEKGESEAQAYGEVKRRLGWEWNGMRLHEYYFGNLSKDGGKKPDVVLSKIINAQFGDFDTWKKDFIATGAMRGIGWAILYKDTQANRLINVWVEEHSNNHFAGEQPLLVMDVYEHAYMADYGTDRAKYIESFFKGIDWDIVSERAKNR